MVLEDNLLERLRSRASEYDRCNAFFAEDLDDLVEAGYMTMFVPGEFGGQGVTLPHMTEIQMALAGAAPATALSVNMHQIWIGVARSVHARNDAGLDWLVREDMACAIVG